MKRNELDELIKRQLENKLTNPPEHLWNRIERELDKTVRKVPMSPIGNWTRIAAIAAGLALIAVLTYTFIFNNDTNAPVTEDTIVKTEENSNPTPQENINTRPIDTIINNNTSTPTNLIYSQNIHSQNTAPAIIEKNNPQILEPSHSTHPTIVYPNNNNVEIAIVETPNNLQDISNKNNTSLLDPTHYPDERRIAPSMQNFNEDLELGIAGGYNYGTLKTGVAMTVNVKKNINDRLFFDGGVGIVMNNANEEIKQFAGDFLKAKSGTPPPGSAARPYNQYSAASQLYYIQVNPTIGYNLTKRLSVIAGPDYQQMLTNQKDVVIIRENPKLLPKADIGVIGGLEYHLAPNLKAGFRAREGVNSLLRNDPNIANREYLQLNLKYQLPID